MCRYLTIGVLTWCLSIVALAEDIEAPDLAIFDSVEVAVEDAIWLGDARTRAIKAYTAFLDTAPKDSNLRPEALRRLADLQLEVAEEAFLENPDGIEAFLVPVKYYKMWLEDYSDEPQKDAVLYQLARGLDSALLGDKALIILQNLVKDFPASIYADEAWFRMGEMHFSNERYAKAQEAYAEAVAFGDVGKFFNNALYKHGWSEFKQANYDEALTSFFDLMDIFLGEQTSADIESQDLSAAAKSMLEDTMRVSSISFSYLGGAPAIAEFLDAREASPPWVDLVYSRLGDLYLEQERYSDAAAAYAGFVELDPNHIRSPGLQTKAIKVFEQGGFLDEVLAAKESFADTYRVPGPFWEVVSDATGEPRSRDAFPLIIKDLKSHTSELAKHYHAKTQKGDVTSVEPAVRWYTQYLESFPEGADTPGMQFLLAELYSQQGQYLSAAENFTATAYEYPTHKQSAESGYAALLSYRQHAASLTPASEEYITWHRLSIDAGLRYAEAFPAHPEQARVLTSASEELYALKEYDRAIGVAQKVTNRTMPADIALERTAWTVIGQSNFDQENFANAESAYRQVLGRTSELATVQDFSERLAASIYSQGEAAKAADDLNTAVGHFRRVANVATPTGVHPVAAYDAATLLITLEKWDEASVALTRFERAYPTHELAASIPETLANTYLKAGNQLQAANTFESIAQSAGDRQKARDALYTALKLYKEQNDVASQARIYETIINRYPYPLNDAMEARQSLVDLADKQKDPRAATRWLAEIVRADQAAAASADGRTDRSRYLAAHALLRMSKPLVVRYKRIELGEPLAQSVKLKKDAMEAALKGLTTAADYGIAEVTSASTYEVAELYADLSEKLMSSPKPKNLDAAALEEYDILLEEQAFPFEEQAIGVHQTNTLRTQENVYNEWVAKSFARLAKLLPARYNKQERGEAYEAAE